MEQGTDNSGTVMKREKKKGWIVGYIIYNNIYYYILYKILSGFFRQFNFCSTVICSLFCCSGKFFPVPLFSGTLISVPLLSVPCSAVPGHKNRPTKKLRMFWKTPLFLGRKICSRPENVVPLHRQSSDTHICPHVVTIAASWERKKHKEPWQSK